MTKITNTIDTIKYGYDPQQFFPIFEGGELRNKREFVAYKLRCIVLKRALI